MIGQLCTRGPPAPIPQAQPTQRGAKLVGAEIVLFDMKGLRILPGESGNEAEAEADSERDSERDSELEAHTTHGNAISRFEAQRAKTLYAFQLVLNFSTNTNTLFAQVSFIHSLEVNKLLEEAIRVSGDGHAARQLDIVAKVAYIVWCAPFWNKDKVQLLFREEFDFRARGELITLGQKTKL